MTVLGTPRAKLFGIPNSVFGISLYFYLIVELSRYHYLISPWALYFLALALARSLYLAFSLLFITKIPCPLCFTGHIINLLLFMVALFPRLMGG